MGTRMQRNMLVMGKVERVYEVKPPALGYFTPMDFGGFYNNRTAFR